jgi:hypothetical protein
VLDLDNVLDFVEQFPCLEPRQAPEIFGPTDINAQSSNGRLAVALNRAGTVTVCRYPSPSFYDQVKHHAHDRDEPYFGALENEGAFLGLRFHDPDESRTVWLRDMDVTQRYADGLTDAVVTTYDAPDRDLRVTVRDVVPPDDDALVREVTVERAPGGPDVSLVAYENLNLVVTKEPRNPVQDWCREGENTDAARYEPDADAVVHTKRGVDESTGEARSVALGLALAGGSDRHQVGGDAHEPAARTGAGVPLDAYENARDGPLRGNDRHVGQTTGALARDLSFAAVGDGDDGETDGDDPPVDWEADGHERATATVLLAAARDAAGLRATLAAVRARDPAALRREKRDWVEGVLDDPPLPDTDDEAVLALARRALVTLVTNRDRSTSGAVVASIATQSPYSLDWPRDGAYFNHALSLVGHDEWVADRNRWYASIQHGPGDERGHPDTPPGNWAMNYYADGVVGGPIPYEIDNTAYAVWTLYDHYDRTGDRAYLEDVWPAIRRAAEFFCRHRDDDTGLHAPAYEDDNLLQSQTIVGAAPVVLGLDAAAAAARELGHDADARRYEHRSGELEAAIERHLWDDVDGAYTGMSHEYDLLRMVPWVRGLVSSLPLVPSTAADPSVVWPVGLEPLDGDRMADHADTLWTELARSFAEPETGERRAGLYETHALIAVAHVWRAQAPDLLDRVRRGVRWVAHEHATPDTHVMGEVWLRRGDRLVTTVSQPHTWAQMLFYYAALEAFPPEGLGGDPSRPVVERLREGR